MSGGKISTTKLSFTLPISCQICLEKVKEPVTCPNQHVFCSLCMDVWLERNKQCPTCRIDITPQSPVRKIIGGMPHAHEEITSPTTSKNLRRARMELLFTDYENEISELRKDLVCLQHTNDDLKARLQMEERRQISESGASIPSCLRCDNMQDIDSMLKMAKNLQEATKTFDHLKNENQELKLKNEQLLKENGDLKRHTALVKEELLMRSPMKFSRLTVATLESRIETYAKQVSRLQKALEKNDHYTESLQTKLSNCACTKPRTERYIPLHQEKTDTTSSEHLLEHDYTSDRSEKIHSSPPVDRATDIEEAEYTTTYNTENILPKDLVLQAFSSAVSEDLTEQDLVITQTNSSVGPFTPSTKLGRLSLSTPNKGSGGGCIMPSVKVEGNNFPERMENVVNSCTKLHDIQMLSPSKDLDLRVKSFTAYTMPTIESPDYKEKLEQIQENLLHPINNKSMSGPDVRTHSFSRRITFDDLLTDDNTKSSTDEMVPLLLSEESIQSIDQDYELSSQECPSSVGFHSMVRYNDSLLQSGNELTESCSNHVLTGLYATEHSLKFDQNGERQSDALSVVDAGGTRITTTKLSQSDRDIFSRPSSAPSRTFLLSGSKFSALRPIDPMVSPGNDAPQFQQIKCKSPSPLPNCHPTTVLSKQSPLSGKKEGMRCVVDGRLCSPILRLVSPDDVFNKNWKQSTSAYLEIDSSFSSIVEPKDKISRVAILKRNNSQGKPLPCSSAKNIAGSPTIPGLKNNTTPVPVSTRRSSRKQCLRSENTKRKGHHSLEFVSPVKSHRVENREMEF